VKAGIHNLSDIKPFWISDRVGNDKKIVFGQSGQKREFFNLR